jgi:hypothetical protein
MDAVTLGHGERTATFTRGTPPEPGDPYNGGHFTVDVRGPGLSATRAVFIYGHTDIAAYLGDLAANWRGWSGARTWESPEYDLTMAATHEAGSHVNIQVTVKDGPVHTWLVTTSVEVEPGEEMAQLARDAGVLTSPRA